MRLTDRFIAALMGVVALICFMPLGLLAAKAVVWLVSGATILDHLSGTVGPGIFLIGMATGAVGFYVVIGACAIWSR